MTTRPERPAPRLGDAAAELRAAGVTGVLTYADADCRLHAVSLPDLIPEPVARRRSCRFTVSLGQAASFGRALPDPGLFLTARSRRGRVELRTSDGHLLALPAGRRPAWRPDGLLTVIRDGDVVELSGPLAEGSYIRERVVLSRRRIARELRRAGWPGYRFSVREVSWLPGLRVAAVVRARSPEDALDLLAVFSAGRLVSAPGFGYERLEGLRPSPYGRFVAARIADPGGLAIVDRDGQPVRYVFSFGNALAWSPNEDWIATALDESVVFVRADDRNPRPIIVPIAARDLAWR